MPEYGLKDNSQTPLGSIPYAIPAALTALLRHQNGTDLAALLEIMAELPVALRKTLVESWTMQAAALKTMMSATNSQDT